MLTSIQASTDVKVLASLVTKAHGPFYCPCCKADMTLAKGSVKQHHFRHKPDSTCAYGKGETETHHLAKLGIYEALKRDPAATVVKIERQLGKDCIADVFAKINGVPTAIELQRKGMTVEDVTEVTLRFTRKGIAVLWVALPTKDIFAEHVVPKDWEKWLHAAYGGRVYYWDQGQTFHAVHFGEHYLRAADTDICKTRSSKLRINGFSKVSNRYKTPRHGRKVSLTSMFYGKRRAAWEGGQVTVPACYLLADNQPVWWQPKSASRPGYQQLAA